MTGEKKREFLEKFDALCRESRVSFTVSEWVTLEDFDEEDHLNTMLELSTKGYGE